MQSDDPDFETKAADVIGLYVNPPDHAAVFAVDEKTAIQALDRLDPVLPLSPGRAERHGFEYYRHGTLSLLAALDTQSGEVLGQTVPRHTSAAFVAFLGDIVATQPKRREIHVIADNLSTHKTQAVRTFLLDHPNVHLHFTPTYSSWLNQVELWFAKIERDLLARGIFTSVADLARKIRRYIRHYNKAPKPIRWNYRNPARRISSTSVSTVHSRVQRLGGLKPLRKCVLLQDPVEEQSGQRAQESGGHRDRRSPRNDVGRFFQATHHMLHYLARRPFPGARGVVQVAADLSAAATRSMTEARLAASTSLKSAMRPPVREPVIDLNEPVERLAAHLRHARPRYHRVRGARVSAARCRQVQ